ncbi:class I SAM-dependent methyltransferase [Streptomyces bambusae]|uniref:methyltransferase domain-containing protein n=1 Tax=Streptomyces bambusae TaxID=1550616 RepID=UPI001CFF1827|nr:class I SAM-dependent methyltransferase [Streptomyces bambusae]MCB5166027.1 class I SAM-dependent methyltransferase [Streptomyces bambusae]
MSEFTSHVRSLERSRAARNRQDRPATFELGGRTWDLLDDVFAPPFSRSTAVSMDLLGLTGTPAPRTGSFLEMGCGTGVIAVSAALAGCDRVTATDINPQAVANTALNARRHGVADRLRTVHGDLFAALAPEERFDTVYWHSNFVLAPADFTYDTLHDRAYVDAGYRAHEGYLAEAPDRLTPGGRALLHFSTRGDLGLLRSLAGRHGRALRLLDSRVDPEGTETVEHLLFEIRATAADAGPTGAASP